jgi:hypothetical protein
MRTKTRDGEGQEEGVEQQIQGEKSNVHTNDMEPTVPDRKHDRRNSIDIVSLPIVIVTLQPRDNNILLLSHHQPRVMHDTHRHSTTCWQAR